MAVKSTMNFAVALLLAMVSSTVALPSESISNAADALSNSGYISMSLTLKLVSHSLLGETTAATIFTPPDSIFAGFGQPTLSLLQLHISPLLFSSSSLRSFLPGTKIPTMSSENYLTVTSPSISSQVSINNVKIAESPIFDDGLLIIFGTESFFDPNFNVSNTPVQIPSFDVCEKSFGDDNNFSFHDAGEVLTSRGYSVMASFLNLQMLGFQSQPSLTLFAPVDEVMTDYSGRFPDYPSLFLRHVLPCKISWRELENVDNTTNLNTYLNGFSLNVTRSGVTLMVNQVPIVFPDMYHSDWLVIHGVHEVFSLPEPAEDADDSGGDDSDSIPFGNDSKKTAVPTASSNNEF